MKNQLFAIAITQITGLMSRRSVYCSKDASSRFSITRFENSDGNIRYRRIEHKWDGIGKKEEQKCVLCGASRKEFDRGDELETHAYEFIHLDKTTEKELRDMKFDVIIGNPPYQLTTNTTDRDAAKQARPIFQLFVETGKKLAPKYMTMIIPARWYSGGIGLSSFRETMLHDQHITKLIDYANSRDCFYGVDIAGGVCYFLWDRDARDICEVTSINGTNRNTTRRALDEFGDIFIRSNQFIGIVHKILASKMKMLDEQVFSLDPFGIPTSSRGLDKPFNGCLKLIHSKGVGYVDYSDITKNKDIVYKWKVTIARVVPCNGEVGIDPTKGYKAITTPRLLSPGTVNTFSYMLLGVFDSRMEAENFKNYMMCKLPRFLLRLTYSSMNIAKNNFMFVPKMDFRQRWTDSILYKFFELSSEEIEMVEATIRPMEGGGDD